MSGSSTQFLKPSEVAERWGCSERHVERLCASGRLQASKLAGWRIKLADLEAYESAQRRGAPPSAHESAREPIKPVFGVLEETGGQRVLGERWWEKATDAAASSAVGRGRATGKKKRLQSANRSR